MYEKKKKQHRYRNDTYDSNKNHEQDNYRKFKTITTMHPFLNDQEARTIERLIRQVPDHFKKE